MYFYIQIPDGNWTKLALTEQYELFDYINDGSQVRLWVRAIDVMGNEAVDFADVYIDNTPPRAANGEITASVADGSYTYTTQ